MENWRPLPIVGEAYADDALPWAAQDLQNWIPVPAERPGTRSPWKLSGAPGMVEFCDLGTGAPVRGTHDVEGLLLAVSGDEAFKVVAGVPTSLGTIPGTGRVGMAHNQITNGYEVMIANGQSGYVYNTTTDTMAQVTDEGFPGMSSPDYVDGYIAGIEPQGRYWFHSELRQATQYNTLDRSDAEAAPDKMLSLAVRAREVVILSQRTGQFFRNTGAATGTFQNANGMEIDVGIANAHAKCVIDNTLCWYGNDGLAYKLDGHTPVIISTGPIAEAMAQLNPAGCFVLKWEDRKHKVAYFCFPDGECFGYDFWTQRWHRRASYGFRRWRVNTLTKSNGQWIGGDFANGKLYRLDWDEPQEDGDPLVARLRSPVVHAEGNPITIAGLRLGFDVGRIPVGVDDHYCSIRYSDDGGHNYTDARLSSLGAAGAYSTLVEERRLGQALARIWEVEVASPGKRDLISADWLAEVVR